MPQPRRLAAGAAVALGLLAARPARAQACAASTLEAYLAATATCTLGGFAHGEFFLFPDVDARSGSGEVALPDPSQVTVTPFTGSDARGRPTFGFRFGGLAVTASVPGGGAGEGVANASFAVGWRSAAALPGTVIRRAAIDYTLLGETGTPGRTNLRLIADALVFGTGPATECVARSRERRGPTDESFTLRGRCDPDPALDLFTIAGGEVRAERGASDRTGAGAATARVDAVTYTAAVVPEPATVVLVGAGLAAGALAARRRG